MTSLTLDFDESVRIRIPFTVTQISAPTGMTAVAVGSGGTFAAGTYFWEVTATTALGETTVSNEASATLVLNGSANLSWTAPVGVVTGYKIYRGTVSGSENVLVTTIVGTATTFTDTNVGGAGTPPTSDTASIQDVLLMTGAGWFCGFSLAETSGTNAAWVEFKDTADNLSECRLSAAGSETEWDYSHGAPLTGKVLVHVNSGSVRGAVYLRIPPIC